MITITLPPEIDAPLTKAARKKGTTPESLALETLGQCFPPTMPKKNMEDAYRRMAQDEAREAEALAWAEGTVGDVADETR